MKNIRKIIMVIIGASIGAGFASGREIYVFFFRFGKPGILGILISSVITGLAIYFTFKISYEKEIDNYNEFVEELNNNHKKINQFIKLIVIIFLLISFFIMIAGFSAFIKQVFNIELYISSTIFVLIVYIVLIKNAQGMLKLNDFLVPVIIVLITFIGIKNIPSAISKLSFLSKIENINWFIYSVLYGSFNSIVLIPIVITLKKYIEKKEEMKTISIISTNIYLILSLLIFVLLLKANFNIEEIEMPIFEVLENNVFKIMYGIIIAFSVFTTAISVGFSFLENISTEKNYKRNLKIICIIGVFISNIGFSNLVEKLYPIFGILGLIQIYFIYKKALEKKANKCYKLCNK